MNYFFDADNLDPPVPHEFSTGRRTGILENLGAGFDAALTGGMSVSRAVNEARARSERIDAIERVSGKSFSQTIEPFRPAPGPDRPADQLRIDDIAIDRWLQTIPERQREGIVPTSMLKARADELAGERLTEDASISARGRGGWEAAAGFAGETAGYISDPLNVAGLAFGAPLAAGVLRTMATEAAIAGATQAGIEAINDPYREELGQPAGLDRALGNVAMTAAGGAAFGGLFKGIPAALRGVLNRGEGRIGERVLSSEQLAAFDQVEAFDDLMHANPFGDTPAGRGEHMRRAQAADEAVLGGRRAADAPNTSASELSAPPRVALGEAAPAGGDATGNMIYHFDPSDLTVDAGAYQFKAGGDAAGVTDRLRDVGTWDPVRAGLALVHERLDGKRYIADGHQRLGLAQRIKAADAAQNPRLTGFLLREADGVTIEDARVIAALKNIAEGTGTPIDAAKVLRARPDAAIDLPASSALVRDAQGLARLSDDAFGMTVNGLVPERYAAIVGRVAGDAPDAQAEIMKVLAREEPANAIEAESIVRDVMSAPAVREIQTDMFGTATATQILYKERAAVLSGAARRLAKDKQAFSVLVREKARIEAEGNVLDAGANLRRAQDDAQTLDTLQKLARRKGPIADALAHAAEQLRAGRKSADVVGDFIGDVRRAVQSELDQGGDLGAARRPDQGAASGGPDAGGLTARALDPNDTSEPSLFSAAPATEEFARAGIRRDAEAGLARFDAAGGEGVQSQTRQLATDLSRDIARDGDFEVPTGFDADGETVRTAKASDLLNDALDDKSFLDGLKGCLK
jgi:hypothetical protein